MKLDTSNWLTIVGIVFAVGGAWASMNAKVEAVDKKIDALAGKQAEPLCLSVLTTQMKAMEKGNDKFKADLAALNQQFCPQPPTDLSEVANMTVPKSEEQKTRELREGNDALSAIIEGMADKPTPSKNELPPDLLNDVNRAN